MSKTTSLFFSFLVIVIVVIGLRALYMYREDVKEVVGKERYEAVFQALNISLEEKALEAKMALKARIEAYKTPIPPPLSEHNKPVSETTKASERNYEAIPPCTDSDWCNIKIPTKSYFRFDPPDDNYLWELSRSQAARGDQILLRESRKIFKNPLDFLDGGVTFKRYHQLSDIFLDHNTDFHELTQQDTTSRGIGPNRPKVKVYPWEAWGYNDPVVPRGYNFRVAQRAPIIQIGYNAFSTANHTEYFEGPHLGEAHVQIPHLVRRWKEVKDVIDTPFILLHAGNENWGLFSTEFPNRTIDWGKCCSQYPEVMDILNHNMTVAVFTNQHHNLTHAKLISVPRGMPIFLPHRKKYIYDMMRVYEKTVMKDTLLFASNSNWKHRPYVSKCIASKFKTEKAMDFHAYNANNMKSAARMSEVEYYKKIAQSRTSVTLAGLGYDSFRLWETLTFGTVPVIEKGIGLDKTLWRLPALLVEDFDEVTPALLRVAYVEALYRANAGQFEFERLTQSFWYSLITNASTSMSAEAVTARFPPESEDPSFARPLVPYQCGERMQHCGPGTKRTPRSSCPGKPVNNNMKRAAV